MLATAADFVLSHGHTSRPHNTNKDAEELGKRLEIASDKEILEVGQVSYDNIEVPSTPGSVSPPPACNPAPSTDESFFQPNSEPQWDPLQLTPPLGWVSVKLAGESACARAKLCMSIVDSDRAIWAEVLLGHFERM